MQSDTKKIKCSSHVGRPTTYILPLDTGVNNTWGAAKSTSIAKCVEDKLVKRN